jgi:DNA-binding CsgD family transcriptional regulator
MARDVEKHTAKTRAFEQSSDESGLARHSRKRLVVSAGFGIAILIDLLYTWGGWVFESAAFIALKDLLMVWTIPHLLASAVTFSALALLGTRLTRRHSKLFLPLGALLILGGHIFLVLTGSSLGLGPFISLAALLIGAGISLFLAVWVQLFDDFSFDESQVIILGSLVVSAILFHVINQLPSSSGVIVSPCLVLLSLAAAYVAARIGTHPHVETLQRVARGGFPGLRTIALLRNPLFCAIAVVFAVPLVRIVALMDFLEVGLINSVSVVVIVLFASTLFLLRYGHGRNQKIFRDFDIPQLYHISLPLIATALVLYALFGRPLSLMVSVLVFALFYLIWMLMIPTCIKAACELGVSPLVTYGISSSIINLVFAASTWLGAVFTTGSGVFGPATLSVCMILVLYVLMIANSARGQRRRGDGGSGGGRGGGGGAGGGRGAGRSGSGSGGGGSGGDGGGSGRGGRGASGSDGGGSGSSGGSRGGVSKRGQGEAEATANEAVFGEGTNERGDNRGDDDALFDLGVTPASIEWACRELSRAHLLTPRESDILVLLASGRDTPYIANQLFISKNTVRTHIKNLYIKMNVHSKQDLLDLLYETCAGNAG